MRTGLSALAAGGLVMGLGAAGASASPPRVQPPTTPPVESAHVVPSGPGVSPYQSTVDQQIQQAQARLAMNVKMPHPGQPEAITHPSQDHTGSGVAVHAASGSDTPGSAGGSHEVMAASTAGYSQFGLDVADYQGNVNWGQVAAEGGSFAYVKATEGTYYDSAYFPQQYNGSAGAGLVRGAYHFAVPNSTTGAAQADYFVARGGGWSADGRTLPGMLDIEYNPYGSECYGLTQAQMVGWTTSFANEYHYLTGRWPDVYTTTDWWSTCTGNSPTLGGQSTLSIANYGSSPYPLPNGWARHTIWQYGYSGIFPGDQDVFNGSHQDLVAFASGTSGINVDRVLTNQELSPGQAITSADSRYVVVMQSDGNLVEYGNGRALWASGTSGRPGAYAVMQGDGNLVVYLGHQALWATVTAGRGPSFAVIQDDANFVVYTNSGTATFASL